MCERLLAEGYSLTGTDIRPNPWHSTINDFTVIADLRCPGDFEKLPTDIDRVVHLAANARVYDQVLNPALARDNLEMLFNTLEFCRKHEIPGFLFASSREVYGDSGTVAHTEAGDGVRFCESPYAASKIGGEALVHAYHRCYGIDFVIPRFSNVYGMYDTSDRVVPLFIKKTRENRDLVVYGRDKHLDFTHIDDTVSGICRCLEKFPAIRNSTFNISSGMSTPVLRVAHLVRKAMNGKNAIHCEENRRGEVMRSAISISAAKKKLGYEPMVSLEEGILRAVAWYRENIFV